MVASRIAFAAVAAAMATSAAEAQRLGRDGACRSNPLPVRPGGLSYMTVSRHGLVGTGPVLFDPHADACPQESKHTLWDFQSQITAYAQAGLGEDEGAAATYTLPASAFPIKLNTAEILFATAGTTVTTTTHWTVFVWEGTPTSGTQVLAESSDGVNLPHLVMGPGTNGTIIQFMVDPGDPQQIVINDNGSHSFTIAFRVDQHNNQTQNPCFTAPPATSNAFPCTDADGLSTLSQNWLLGLNCGLEQFNCPPMPSQNPPPARWAMFSELIATGTFACRPSGDWLIRATWQSLACTPGVGACCKTDGTCETLAVASCTGAGGTYQGDGVSCATVTCPAATAACCFPNNSCLMRTQGSCQSLNGTWLGAGTSCSGGSCPTGACCFPAGTCTAGITAGACTSQGGTFQGVGSACGNCPQPTGACCTSGGGCDTLTQADCTLIGGAWQGAGTPCTLCTPTGACCTGGGGCDVLTQADCMLIGGSWQGGGTTCAACSTPVCYANCDQSTTPPVLNVQDFGCFLTRYASGDAYANCDQSTTPPVLNVQDFGCFLTRYAAGCP